MLENLSKTVVVTGSQIPLCRPRNDGIANLLGSLAVAGNFDIPEVTLFFGSRLLRGCRASKVNASSLEGAFDAPNATPLGSVGIGIQLKWNIVKHVPSSPLRLESGFSDNIAIIRIFPGQFTTLKQTIAEPLKGLVLQTFGAGNGPDADAYFLATLKEATDRGLVVVNGEFSTFLILDDSIILTFDTMMIFSNTVPSWLRRSSLRYWHCSRRGRSRVWAGHDVRGGAREARMAPG
jgi:L-asparaginase/Glu-tRNA(Gln) amidotransferase subunit D